MPAKLTHDEFVSRALLVHGNRYDYTNAVYTNLKTRVSIKCPIHGHFDQKPREHLDGSGCGDCYQESRYNTQEEFIYRSTVMHDDRYNYSRVNYIKSDIKVTIICPIHGAFDQMPYLHMQGHGCYECALAAKPRKYDEFVSLAQQVHGTDRYNYDSAVYVNNKHPIKILCNLHDEYFWVKPVNHTSNHQGCPICAAAGFSKKAHDWIEFMIMRGGIHILHSGNNAGVEYRIPSTRFKADGYCESTNTIFEFHGDSFHGNPHIFECDDLCHPYNKEITAGELYTKTLIREDAIKSLGYNLVVMWEHDWDLFVKENKKVII